MMTIPLHGWIRHFGFVMLLLVTMEFFILGGGARLLGRESTLIGSRLSGRESILISLGVELRQMVDVSFKPGFKASPIPS